MAPQLAVIRAFKDRANRPSIARLRKVQLWADPRSTSSKSACCRLWITGGVAALVGNMSATASPPHICRLSSGMVWRMPGT